MALPMALGILDHRMRETAEEIHAVRTAAYAQEAALLQVSSFPPLERTVDDILRSADTFIGARFGTDLAGALGIEREAPNAVPWLSSLVVAPAFQRRGVASGLLSFFLGTQHGEVMVSTDTRNAPALELYARFGFVPVNCRTVGEGMFEIVELKWNAGGKR